MAEFNISSQRVCVLTETILISNLCTFCLGGGGVEGQVSVHGLRRNTCVDISHLINLCKILINC